jgi:four helix bundle protein
MDPEELRERTKRFSHRCVKLALALPNTPLGDLIRGQRLRCSTSVSSNCRAACLAQSKAHFVAKMSIVTEEADESAFWLQFIIDEALLARPRVVPLMNEADELTRIFVSGRKTAKNRSIEFRGRTRSGHNNQ